MSRLIAVFVLLSTGCNGKGGCKIHDKEDEFAAVLKRATGPCLAGQGKSLSTLTCVDGRALIICTSDDGCITVPLDAEVSK